MSEWQPIETAPRDGSDVLIWCDTGKICIAHFDYATFAWWSDLSTRECPDPTHWMPLPAPPAEVVQLRKEEGKARPGPNMKRPKTWGDVYRKYLRRGYDQTYADYAANKWERRKLPTPFPTPIKKDTETL